ncbi:MAG: hypothetical protein ACRC1P_10275 [Cellulosilyticaceae bacterium]
MIGNENIKTWEEFKELEITKQVEIINGLISEGHSIPKISSSLEGKFGKPLDRTVIRKHFLRFGYRVVDDLFVFDGTIEPKPVTEPKPRPNQITRTVTNSYTAQFTDEEQEILQRLIREVKLRDSIVESVPEEDKGESTNRNIRVYPSQYQEFAEFCKVNHLKQADALYDAISDFMKKYK